LVDRILRPKDPDPDSVGFGFVPSTSHDRGAVFDDMATFFICCHTKAAHGVDLTVDVVSVIPQKAVACQTADEDAKVFPAKCTLMAIAV
jgi:hypothetical protein